MMSNPYLSEKPAQAHYEDLLREAEQQRMVAQLPEPSRRRHVLPARLVSFLRARSEGPLSVRRYQGARQGDVVFVALFVNSSACNNSDT